MSARRSDPARARRAGALARVLAALVLLGVAGLGACASNPEDRRIPELATFRLAADFESYAVRRVGLMPFAGEDLAGDRAAGLQMAFLAEISRSTPFEVVLLDSVDLSEMRGSEPYRRGWYSPATIIEAARRYSLDALLFGTVIQQQFFPPQMLSVQMDLVAAETGLVIWSSSVHLDASDERVIAGLRQFYGAPMEAGGAGGGDDVGWELALVSPRRFARFAAYQIAKGL